MKLFFLLLTLWFTVTLYSQPDSLLKKIVIKDSTAIGTPVGQSISRSIGSSGGTIISPDGRVELIFPQGALSKETTISIQPTTNNAPNGKGLAYWFEPSGTHFNKPVAMIFHYSEEEAEESDPELMSYAVQDQKGKWQPFSFEKIDTIAKTLKGYIHHFSGVSRFDDLSLAWINDDRAIRAGDYNYFYILDLSRKTDVNGVPTYDPAVLNEKVQIQVFVDNKLWGDNIKGSVRRTGSSMFFEYLAPEIIPPKNPVPIVVKIKQKDSVKKPAAIILTSVEVWDNYKVKVECKFSGREKFNAELTDSAVFIATVVPEKVVIIDIKNYEPVSQKNGRSGPFKELHHTKGVTGVIHLQEPYKKITLSKNYPHEVYIEFFPWLVTRMRFEYTFPGGSSGIHPEDLPTWGIETKFLAKPERQVITVGPTGYQYVVTVERFK